MLLGTLIHTGVRAFWAHEPIIDAMAEAAGIDVGVFNHLAESVDPYSKAVWLMDRYSRYYADNDYTVIGAEMEISSRIPGTSILVVSHVDHLVKTGDDNLWLVERKTMSDWSRLDLIDVDPQLTLYYWNLRMNGYDVYGIMFDAIRTYRWKPEKPSQKDVIAAAENEGMEWPTTKARTEWAREQVLWHPGIERPLSESFSQLWLDRTDEQVESALKWARAIEDRRQALKVTPADAIRNIGPLCKACFYRDDCFEQFAFPHTEFEVEE
jgi:hypothetical protein